MVYLYIIKCPLTDDVRYVGKTISPDERFRKHLSGYGNSKKSMWIRGLKNKSLNPVFEIIDRVDESKWEDSEREYIKMFKELGFDLLNQLPGGEGGATMAGRKLTDEQRAKITASKVGRPNKGAAKSNKDNKGQPVSQYDLAGNFIARHKSINDAAKSINRSSRRIQMMLSGSGKKVNHVGGYTFSAS